MTQQKSSQNRRSFLKSSTLAGGGLLLSFTWLSAFKPAGAMGAAGLPGDWVEINGYIKITADNIVKILNPNPEFGQNVRPRCL